MSKDTCARSVRIGRWPDDRVVFCGHKERQHDENGCSRTHLVEAPNGGPGIVRCPCVAFREPAQIVAHESSR